MAQTGRIAVNLGFIQKVSLSLVKVVGLHSIFSSSLTIIILCTWGTKVWRQMAIQFTPANHGFGVRKLKSSSDKRQKTIHV